ncbi:MAG: peroxiredoxin [Methylotenera sp.]|nr:MAG: peroxiredoxin [Methylotenera sp.]PPD13519.1 MAG: peroxiredoxin [Methylotenera sp.]
MLTKILFYSVILVVAFLGYRHFSSSQAPLKVNDKAPYFNLPNASGEMMNLNSFKGSWLVLYFYPKDDTPGCTKEACEFRDDLHKLENLGAKVVGISVDDGSSHAAFAKKYNLPFPLLSDKDGLVAREYNALTNLGLIKIAKRYTFLIDPNSTLRKIYLSVDASKHSEEIINDLEKLI